MKMGKAARWEGPAGPPPYHPRDRGQRRSACSRSDHHHGAGIAVEHQEMGEDDRRVARAQYRRPEQRAVHDIVIDAGQDPKLI